MGRSIQSVITLRRTRKGMLQCASPACYVTRRKRVEGQVLDNQGERGVTEGEISEDSMNSGAIVMANNRISWLFLFAN
ncbi:hypothetical protein Peur_071850 [Populus x canadensis]